ncbi:hypothetical protein GIB67_040071 [Kingdonia uniflora]|uniref:Uncharacterized protein n=1 Tax=Kingdonia uniflora TaxID=39325 RepID=A0A7J7MUR0_9MAGN|nr:hypothetical protein GIB67_040071 [Kingdonia uniflora]
MNLITILSPCYAYGLFSACIVGFGNAGKFIRLFILERGPNRLVGRIITMAMPWGMALSLAKVVWIAVCEWISSCMLVAHEIARALRVGDIGPFHVG